MDVSKKVLIVDDFDAIQRMMMKRLRQLGFENIIVAKDGATAFSELKKHGIDIIISEGIMPQMTGIELLKAVRKDDELKDIPFFMVTDEGRKGNVLEAIEEGVTNYIVKPFTKEQVEEKLTRQQDILLT